MMIDGINQLPAPVNFYQKDIIEVLPPRAGGVDDVLSIDMWIYRCHDVMM